jgi:sulfate adenylyltransferase subunit 1
MDAIKIATAGSVDDGKSTLIGRLLYETKSLKQDQLEQLTKKSRQKGYDYIDFSLATDGLLTERAQGITIDVSHLYLTTPKRRYVIADAPGHQEYTRNMVTGASNAQAAVVLLDARKGVV